MEDGHDFSMPKPREMIRSRGVLELVSTLVF
jgi:hypothetical protein